MHQAAKVIGVSNAVSKSVYQYGMVNDKIITVYDSVDMVAFEKAVIERLKTRHEVGLKESDVATGIFGRIVPWKGQLEFTYAALQAIKVNQKIKVVIVGDESDGLEDYFNKIKDVIHRSGYQDHFILTGYKEDVEELFAAMDIVVHASIEPEPFGMVVIEAMAASKPVIATNAGGPSEIINSMVEGILVPPGDIKEMTAAILELVNDSAKRESMGRRGHAKVRTQYTNQIISSKIEKVYQDLMCHTMRETQA
jgi:glycosyltransferase involved in cell wall biosynthesis